MTNSRVSDRRGATGVNLALQVSVVFAGLAALLNVTAHQFAHNLGSRPIFASHFGHEVSALTLVPASS